MRRPIMLPRLMIGVLRTCPWWMGLDSDSYAPGAHARETTDGSVPGSTLMGGRLGGGGKGGMHTHGIAN